ncbi:MAG: hypothetical protein ACPGN3_09160 [Opitutales bacterium]
MSSLSQQSVIVDQEPVTFEGPPPADIQQLYQLIDQALTGAGRLITAIEIDGEDAYANPARLNVPKYNSVNITSSEWQPVCQKSIQQQLPAAEEAANSLIAYGSAMLAVPLAHSLSEVNTAADKMGALIAPIETAHQFAAQFAPEWADACEEIYQSANDACETFTDALKTQDVGIAAESLVVSLPDALKALKTLTETPWNA